MSSIASGRHRSPSRLSVKPVARVGAVVAVASGLALSTSGASQATRGPAQPATPVGATTGTAVGATGTATLPQAVPSAALTAAAATPALPTRSFPKLRWGSRGSSVKSVQRIVGSYADGIFGPKTHAAVKRYQSRKGLLVDGIVGPNTARAMGLSSSRSSSSASRSSGRSGSVLSNAARYVGVPYRYAGSSPSTGFDCSGFTSYVFAKAGINIPRTAAAQQRASRRVSNPRPGDLVFYNYPASHAAIYAGNGMIYDAGRTPYRVTKRRMWAGNISYGRIG